MKRMACTAFRVATNFPYLALVPAKKKELQDDAADEVFFYRPKFRTVTYITDLSAALFKHGKFSSQRAVRSSFADKLSAGQGVVGADNGNVDLTRPRGRNSAHRISSYIAKYVMKNVEEVELNAKSYWSSRDIVMPKPEKHWFPDTMSTWEIVSLVAKQFIAKGFTDIAQYADRMNAFHWFSASLP